MPSIAPLSRVRARRRAIAALLLTLHTAGCVSWQVVTVPELAKPNVKADAKADVRATTADGNAIVMSEVTIVGDSLCGRIRDGANATRCLAHRDITALEIQRANSGDTVALVVVLVLAAIVAISSSYDHSPKSSTGSPWRFN